MQEKVKLPKEVVDAVDYLQSGYDYPIRKTIEIFNGEYHCDAPLKHLSDYFQSDRSRRIELVTKALVIGCEVELTTEELIWDFYHNKTSCDMHAHHAIKHVLNILNIKIEGVNA